MCSFIAQILREHAIGMLTAGMSTRAVACELNVHFSPKAFQIIWQYIQHNRRPRVTGPRQPRTSTSSIFSSKIIWDQPPGQLLQQSVCITKECLHKLSETISGKLICMLVVLIRVSTWLQFVVVTDLSGQMLTFDGVWHFGEVFSSRMNPGFHCTGQMADRVLQHDNAWPYVARICTQFLEAENIPVLAWPVYSPDMSPIEHVWDALDRRVRQRVPVPANIQQLRTAIEEEWTNIPQATINNLINSMRRRFVALREANGGPTGYWLVFEPPGPPQYSKTAHFWVAFYCGQPMAHLCYNHAA